MNYKRAIKQMFLGAATLIGVFSSSCSVWASEPVTDFTDSCGTQFHLEKPLEKIIVLNRQTAEAVKILGAEDKVIATGDTTVENNSYLGYNDLPDMGDTGELNLEAIIALDPDAVFVHTNRAMELEDTLTPAGIEVIRIDNYQPQNFDEELLLLGSILGKEERAEEFLEYKNTIEQDTASRVAQIDDSKRKTVMALSVGFMNSQGGYRIFPCMNIDGDMGVGEGYSTILAGGIDASPEIQYDPAIGDTTILVDEEYALSCNPQVITLHGTWLGGYNCTDEADFQTVLDNIYDISSISQTDAGKNKEVYIFHTDFLGASKRHIGVLQLCKYLYPEEFSDINTEEYAEEYFENWLNTEYKGIWYYAAK
ncbi:MAG: ABC transporter substrate-binding protein [Eubacteriales bacterium]|nr:ABC transporter substrate-binding protein [Eubacteriales bacterium]